jgi:hypothetical protein
MIPPSNNRYMGKGGAWIQHAYQHDKHEWAGIVAAYCRPIPDAPLELSRVTLEYHFPTRAKRDPDNYSGKFILDGLVGLGAIVDDNFWVMELVLATARVDKGRPGTLVTLEDLEGIEA